MVLLISVVFSQLSFYLIHLNPKLQIRARLGEHLNRSSKQASPPILLMACSAEQTDEFLERLKPWLWNILQRIPVPASAFVGLHILRFLSLHYRHHVRVCWALLEMLDVRE